jgi:very-short-patch-repair endonuclease
MTEFNRNIEDLAVYLDARKDNIKKYLFKHFQRNQDYIIVAVEKDKPKTHGGHNKEVILLREDVFNLIKHTYNIRNQYITKINDVDIKNPLLMSVETASLGFIQDVFKDVIEMKRQFKVGKYYIDLYIPKFKLAIECDEYGHQTYSVAAETTRQKFIEDTLGCKFIRFDPCDSNFDITQLMNTIMKELFSAQMA